MSEHIRIELIPNDEGLAYDLTITAACTLADYIQGLDAFLDEKVAACLGCDLCCYQRIPLTLPDMRNYCGTDDAALLRFIAAKTVVRKNGLALDIRLKQGADERCIFLDETEARCLDHPHRGLVCHTYICLPQTERARRLREFLINEGEDALIGHLFALNALPQFQALAAGYPPKPAWEGKGYDELYLRDLLDDELFALLSDTEPARG